MPRPVISPLPPETSPAPFEAEPLRAIAGAIHNGRRRVQEIWDASETAIAAREPSVNAFISTETPAARRARYEAADISGPLAGLPFGVKDIFDTADLTTEYGSPIYSGHRPGRDAVCVALARRAGGVMAGKTVTTEFASFHPGKTSNPHNAAHTPGGSSSGSAAAVAARMLPLALGTQTGGSVIRPASFSGVVGYKPSFNMIPSAGLKTFSWSLDTVGVFALTVDDAGFFVECITGRDLGCATPTEGLHFGICETPMIAEAADETHEALAHARQVLEGAGHRVSTHSLPAVFGMAHEAHTVLNDGEGALALAHEYDHHRDALSETLVKIIENGLGFDSGTYDTARQTMKAARLSLLDVWRAVDVLVVPAAPGEAPRGLHTTGNSAFNRLWTAMGVPCITLPCTTGPNGLPVGIQLVAPALDETRALMAAATLEAALLRTRG